MQPTTDAVAPIMDDDQEVSVGQFEGEVHVSFKSVKNTVPAQRYKLLVGEFQHIVSSVKGTAGVRVSLKYDPIMHSEYEKRTLNERFWITPDSMNIMLGFMLAAGINREMLREEPVQPPQFNPDGSAVTKCVYSLDEQLKSLYGAAVYGEVLDEEYDGLAADGVTPEKKWRNTVGTRGWSKV